MKSRISIFFSAIVLLTTLSNVHAMQPAKRLARGTKKQFNSWIDAIGQAINGEASPRDAQIQIIGMDPFKNLSTPEQGQIILLLNEYDAAQSLATAGRTINSLAQVNKQLNALINEPQFCLQLTKRLAYQFNTSHDEVWLALQTDCAKTNLIFQQELRKDLRYLCINAKQLGAIRTMQSLSQLVRKGADLNFFYENEGPALIIAMYHNNFDLAGTLIELGANPLATDTEGMTALAIAQMMENDELIARIEKAMQKLSSKK